MGLCSHLGFLNVLYPHNTFCLGTIRDHLEDGIASHKLSLFVLTIVCHVLFFLLHQNAIRDFVPEGRGPDTWFPGKARSLRLMSMVGKVGRSGDY